MKLQSILILTTFTLSVSIAPSGAQQMERTFERTLTLSGPVSLDLSTDSGGIQVVPGPAGTVRIRGILKASARFLRSSDVEDRIRQLETNPPIEQSGNTVKVGYVRPNMLRDISMRLEIVAPSDAQVRARADSGGIHVEGVRGPVDCKTDSGGVEARNIGSEVRAEADSGGIHLRGIKGPVHARSDSGGIEALEVGGSIDVQTDSGGIRLSQTVAAPVRARADSGGASLTLASTGGYDVRVRTDSGRLHLPEMSIRGAVSRHSAEGRVRSGGPLVDIEVNSGNIEIR